MRQFFRSAMNIQHKQKKIGNNISFNNENISRRVKELEKVFTIISEENESFRRDLKQKRFSQRISSSKKATPNDIDNTNSAKPPAIEISHRAVLSWKAICDIEDLGNHSNVADVVIKWRKVYENIRKRTEVANLNYSLLKERSYYEDLEKLMISKEDIKENHEEKIEMLKEKLMFLRQMKKDLGLENSSNASSFKKTVDKVCHIYERSGDNDPFMACLKDGSFDSDEPNIVASIKNHFKYINAFKQFFQEGRYKEAAIQALQSPQRILINLEVFNMFKDVDGAKEYSASTSPLMFLCEGLMQRSWNDYKFSGKICVEMIKCALKYKNEVIIRYWTTKKHFSPSVNAGNCLMEACRCETKCTCSLHDLALNIFLKHDIPRLACICYVKLGAYRSMIKMAKRAQFKQSDYEHLFHTYPSVALFHALNKNHLMISLVKATSLLLEQEKLIECKELIKDIHENGCNGRSLFQVFLSEKESIYNVQEQLEDLLRFLETINEDVLFEEILSCVVTSKAMESSSINQLTNYFS